MFYMYIFTAQFIQGQWLNATEAMIGMNKWKCTARNYVGGVMYQDSVVASFEVGELVMPILCH